MDEETTNHTKGVNGDAIDPIHDIIDYLVRCANISFKTSHVDEDHVRTADKIELAYRLFTKTPTYFLKQFGKYLSPNHLPYFENLQNDIKYKCPAYIECLNYLKEYHSDRSRHKRVRNRRYRALQKMQEETDYFSEKQMMFRNPLLYEQLIGQYLNEDDVIKRDGGDSTNIYFLNVILNTVEMNEMKEMKHKQMLQESMETEVLAEQTKKVEKESKPKKKMWGEFDEPDTRPEPQFESYAVEQTVNSRERVLLREEFVQEMYSSFLDGRDEEIDYNSIDNNEKYDDLQQISQDAEDKYFDDELNDVNNLEEHMKLVEEYGKKPSSDGLETCDPLDVFMQQIKNKIDD